VQIAQREATKWQQSQESCKKYWIHAKKINIESYTFAGTSARRYRIVDAEERSWWNLFNKLSSSCGLKSIDINKANTLKNVRHNIEFTFPHQKKKLQKKIRLKNMTLFVTWLVAFFIYHVIGALTLYMWHTNGCVLTSTRTFTRTIHKNIKKLFLQNTFKKILFCHARNCHARNLKISSVHCNKITKILAPFQPL
jgi:hypothetical protein